MHLWLVAIIEYDFSCYLVLISIFSHHLHSSWHRRPFHAVFREDTNTNTHTHTIFAHRLCTFQPYSVSNTVPSQYLILYKWHHNILRLTSLAFPLLYFHASCCTKRIPFVHYTIANRLNSHCRTDYMDWMTSYEMQFQECFEMMFKSLMLWLGRIQPHFRGSNHCKCNRIPRTRIVEYSSAFVSGSNRYILSLRMILSSKCIPMLLHFSIW